MRRKHRWLDSLLARAAARRCGAIAGPYIHRFFERSELILSLAARRGRGSATGRKSQDAETGVRIAERGTFELEGAEAASVTAPHPLTHH